ncbi:hypothetical protein LS482_03375 [Sinomicrobium kalidii]|uniref:hypothetical protein n=1 Tax=Sinomicrobium kalidii TaxID=2900738 RepID=UPI001E5A95C3|nr:hypothetical protein [Sinomicrobium kalidii]UGU16921.1 hypothetical protein LS482_03375 [Sinomicrobium kalidii]
MKKQILNLGTPLDKQQQRTITGGKKQCVGPDLTCIEYGPHCAELICQIGPL